MSDDELKQERLEAARKKAKLKRKKNKKKKKDESGSKRESHEDVEESPQPELQELPKEALAQEPLEKDSPQNPENSENPPTETEHDAKISDLTKENNALKAERITLLQKIENLEQNLKRLTHKAAFARVDDNENVSDNSVLSSSVVDPHSFMAIHDPESEEAFFKSSELFKRDMSDAVNLREKLVRWSDWQVDMRKWRSVGAGPILDL